MLIAIHLVGNFKIFFYPGMSDFANVMVVTGTICQVSCFKQGDDWDNQNVRRIAVTVRSQSFL